MRRLFFFTVCAFFVNFSIAQVGIGTVVPDASSVLDISASDKGILIPQISLGDVTDTMLDGANTAATGLLIYNTNAAVTGGTGVGYYYFNGSSWERLLTTATTTVDIDWYEEGGTTPPNDINDDMYTQGQVAIGKTTADWPLDVQSSIGGRGMFVLMDGSVNTTTYGLLSEVTNSSDATMVGLFGRVLSNGDGEQRGMQTLISGSGSGDHYGTYSQLNGTGTGTMYGNASFISTSGNGVNYGTYNSLTGAGNGTHRGTYNLLSSSGSGSQTGFYSNMTGSGSGEIRGFVASMTGTNTGIHRGFYVNNANDGDSDHFGGFNLLQGDGNGAHYGVYNQLVGGGTNVHYGVRSDLNGSGTGAQVGKRNIIGNSGSGDHWGTYSTLTGSGAGTKYGSQIVISAAAGGTHYGIHADVQKAGSYAGYFVGDVLGDSRLELTDATLDATPVAGTGILELGGSLRLDANEIITNTATTLFLQHSNDGDLRVDNTTFMVDADVDRVGIGTITPAYTLEVSGAIMMEDSGAPVASAGHSGIYSRLGEVAAFDSAGNATIISPHHFEFMEPSEEMAWSFYSRNDQKGQQINVDMLKAIRLVEELTGEKLVYLADLDGKEITSEINGSNLMEKVRNLTNENDDLKAELREHKLELNAMKTLLDRIIQKQE
jgi:hypothetical protein